MYDLGCRENGALKLIFVDSLIVFRDRASFSKLFKLKQTYLKLF